MAIQICDDLSKVSGVGAGQRFTVEHPVGKFAVDSVGFELGGTTFAKSHLTNLRVDVSGKPIQQYRSAADLEAIAGYYGEPILANRLVFPFRPEFLLNPSDADTLNLGLWDVNSFQVSGDIAGAAVAPALRAYSDRRVMDVEALNKLGMFLKVVNLGHSVVGSAQTEIDNIVKEAFIVGIHIKHTGSLTGAQVLRNSQVVLNGAATTGGVGRLHDRYRRLGRVPQNNWLHLDFLTRNDLQDALLVQGAYDFRLKLDHSGSDQLTTYVVYASDWNGL